MSSEYPLGIDYSLGKANRDLANGIHYGVINQHEVLQFWADNSEPYYGENEYCPECGNELEKKENENDPEIEFYCENCEKELTSEDIFNDFAEPISFYIDDNEYSAECGDMGDIFITKSPYYTTCQFCSPCAPGAGYIMNTVTDGIKTYCFPHDFFEDDIAPYPVYSVETGKLVEPNPPCIQCKSRFSELNENGFCIYCIRQNKTDKETK
jgi:hypothetical protein